jgi:riboflavin synthase
VFTGLIEETGSLRGMTASGFSARLRVRARRVLEGSAIGDSIAVNGVCLTVAALLGDGFEADAMQETLERSALGGLRPGASLNLERALRLTDRLGGHLVCGHVDGTGSIRRVAAQGIARILEIRIDPGLMRLVAEKGSIAVDGVSLTVRSLLPGGFDVSLVPHSLAHTNLFDRKAGDRVNIECDLLAKQAERLLLARPGGLTLGTLRDSGFIGRGGT